MTRPRRSPSLEDKLAAALLDLGQIPYADAKAMGRTNFLSLFHFDHGHRHAEDGSDEFWNLTPRLIPPHRKKTAEVDIPEIAKGKRIRRANVAHAEKRLIQSAHDRGEAIAAALPALRTMPKRAIPSRPFSKQSRPMQSRKFLKRNR